MRATREARLIYTAAGLAKSPTGIRGFDQITGGGLPRGRPTLVTGAAGSGKTLLGLQFLMRGARDLDEPGVLMTFEESAADITQNVRSLGFDLAEMEREGRLVIDAFRVDPAEIVTTGAFDLEGLFLRLSSAVEEVGAKRVVLDTIETLFGALGNPGIVRGELGRLFRWLKDHGLTAVVTAERGREGQLTRFGIRLDELLEELSPSLVVLDAVASLAGAGTLREVTSAVTREMDLIKGRGITGVLTALNHGDDDGISGLAVSSLIDTWVGLRNVERDGERNRLLDVIKSRGTAHSNQVREFLLTDQGPRLVDVFVGPEGVLTGSARELAMAARRHDGPGGEEDDRARDASARRRQDGEQTTGSEVLR